MKQAHKSDEQTTDSDDRETVYDAYPDVEIPKYGAQEVIREHFDAHIDVQVAMMLAESYTTVRSLSGATAGLLRIGRGMDSDAMREFFGVDPGNPDLTIAHAQQNRNLGPFETEDK